MDVPRYGSPVPSSNTASEALHARVVAFIDASLHRAPAEPFDALALSIARFQAEHIPALARLARARGVDLASAQRADAIPAVPCDVFRLARIAAHPRAEDRIVFRTSGTSQGREARGEHALRTTSTYERAAIAWGERLLFPDSPRLRAIVLAPSREEQADSSLGFMIERFAAHLGGPVHHGLRAGGLDVDAVAHAAAEARAVKAPAIVLGTSFALVHLLDASAGRDLRLPPGSRVMQTGGFKGRSREIPPDELRCAVARCFGLPEAFVVAEYGMTELSSQLYEGTLAVALRDRAPGSASSAGSILHGPARHGVYVAPPWVRVTAVDPVSLAPVGGGEVGIARIVDLANVDSAVAIQTADRVRVLQEGVELLGRASGAPPRGCSIAADEMLERA
jgi:hypothetical protein